MADFIDLFRKTETPSPGDVTTGPKHYFVLLLGNGFDIQCGLKTRYKDFFDDSMNNESSELGGENGPYSKIDKILRKNEEDPKEKLGITFEVYFKGFETLSIWDAYFIHIKNKYSWDNLNWIDIEREMSDSLVKDHFWDAVCEKFVEIYQDKTKLEDFNNRSNSIEVVLALTMYRRYFLDNNDKFKGKIPGKDAKKVFYEKLVDELKIFERRFGEYIRKQYETNKNEYVRVSQENITRIYKAAVREMRFIENDCLLRIFSFNYIPLMDEKLNKDNRYIHYVHGGLEDPIFCIDQVEKDEPNAKYYNYFSNETRERHYRVSNYKKLLPNGLGGVTVLTYGLSFGSDVDTYDFMRILNPYPQDMPEYDRLKKTNPHGFNRMILFYPNQKNQTKNDEMTTEITDNMDTLIRTIDNNSSFQELEDRGIVSTICLDLEKL